MLSHSKDIGSIPIQFMGKSLLKLLIIVFPATVRLVGQDVALSRQRHGFKSHTVQWVGSLELIVLMLLSRRFDS